MWNDFADRAVLVTGGTRGIGLATALAFGREGADVTLTHKWGSVDESAIVDAFAAAGAPPPHIVTADAGHEDDIREVLQGIRARHERLEVFVSNVAFGATVENVEAYTRRKLQSGIDYSAWPLVSHTLAAREIFGRPPRYVVGISSEGVESMHVGYDLIAAAKAVLETLCRYLHYRLREEGTCVNVVRTRFVDTVSLADTFGADFRPFVERFEPDVLTAPSVIADAILGICAGPFDALGGQVITVDGGAGLYENFSRLYQERDIHPITSKEKP